MTRALVLLLCLGLCGCVTVPDNYRERFYSLKVGMTKAEVIALNVCYPLNIGMVNTRNCNVFGCSETYDCPNAYLTFNDDVLTNIYQH